MAGLTIQSGYAHFSCTPERGFIKILRIYLSLKYYINCAFLTYFIEKSLDIEEILNYDS